MQSPILFQCIFVFVPVSKLNACLLTVFPSQFKFDGKFVSLSPRFQQSNSYKCLHIARQLHCRTMDKTLFRSDGWILNYHKADFPNNFNSEQKKIFNKTVQAVSGVMSCLWRYQVPLWFENQHTYRTCNLDEFGDEYHFLMVYTLCEDEKSVISIALTHSALWISLPVGKISSY